MDNNNTTVSGTFARVDSSNGRINIYEYDPDGKATKQYIEVAQKLALRILDEE